MRQIVAAGAVAVALCGMVAERLSGDDKQSDAKKPAKSSTKADAIPADARQKLEAAGLKVMTSGISLPDEAELGKTVRELAKQKKAMMAADREVYAAQREIAGLREQISELKVQYTNLNAELTTVTDAVSHNRIAGAVNATVGQIDQLNEKGKQTDERLKEARKGAADVRDIFVQNVLAARAKAEEITRQWTQLGDDREARASLDKVNQALGAKFVLKPSASFAANVKQLKAMEDAVSSEAIKLENESNSLWVTVTINGKDKQRMIVDSGATSLSLSHAAARNLGIKIGADGIPIRVGLADGRKVPGTIIKLDSVRVGKFTVEDVECCVLGPEAPEAPPLLGMSFLGQFKFEVDAQQAELKLVKVDSGEPIPKDKPGKGKTAKKKK
jgi:aspartyl protease family protein